MSSNAETTAMLTKAREEYAIAELSNDQYIAGIQAKVLALPPATEKEGYELRRKTIADLRKIRTTIEARRKELKADSLAYGRRIDAFAKHWTAQIEAIEQPLVLEKQAVDEAKEKVKREAEEAERRRQEEEARQRIQAEEARLAEIRKAEEAKLAEERARLREAAERIRKIEEEQRKAQDHQRAEEERFIAERTAFEEEKRRAEQAEATRVAAENQAIAMKAKQEREAAEAAQAEKERLERAERIKPDLVKLREYAKKLLAIPLPEVRTDNAKDLLKDFHTQMIHFAADVTPPP